MCWSAQKWDASLAYTAEMHARTCANDHDDCRNTHQWLITGQNLHALSNPGKQFDDFVAFVCGGVCDWFKECTLTTMEKAIPNKKPEKKVGHFTQLVRDKASRVGCAISVWHGPLGYYLHWLVCNYNEQPYPGARIYVTGTQPCSECPKGTRCSGCPKGFHCDALYMEALCRDANDAPLSSDLMVAGGRRVTGILLAGVGPVGVVVVVVVCWVAVAAAIGWWQ